MSHVIRSDAAEDHELVAASDNIDGVDLQAAEIADDGENAIRGWLGWGAREALTSDGEAAGGR